MHSIYLCDADFHIATEKEREEIRQGQRRHRIKCWLKRFFLSVVLIGIFVIFQLIARKTVPNRIDPSRTVETLLRYAVYTFLGVNVFSYLQLLFGTRVIFNIKKAEVIKLRVTKKVVVDEVRKYPSIRVKFKYLVCELEDNFIMDRIWVRGPIAFSNIKEGQEIYVERLHNEGEYKYYFVA